MWPFIWPLKIERAMHLSSVRKAGAAAAARPLGEVAKNNNKSLALGKMAGNKALRTSLFTFYQLHKDKGPKSLLW